MNLRPSKYILTAALFILPTASAVVAEECTAGEAAFAAETVENVAAICCSKATPKAKNTCFASATKAVSKTRGIFSSALTAEINAGIAAVQNEDCVLDNLDVLECTDALSFTVDEAKDIIKKRACNLKYNSDRLEKLAQYRRSIKKARSYLGSEYGRSVLSEIRKLKNSKTCGDGGESKTGCNSIRTPNDGASRGYLYKPSGDHSSMPVWLSPSYGSQVVVITETGDPIESLRYTGVANGYRHHHRFARSCGSYPDRFLIKEGSSCFLINGSCSRHD